jgi:flagellar biosynthesis GTPase FlhF
MSNNIKPTKMIKPEIIKYCAYCNDRFSASRPTATYCSNTCRTKACLKRKQEEQAKADQEAERLKELDRLRQIADEKRKKREQKAELKRQEQEKQAEKDRKDLEAKRIQDEQFAAALLEKERNDAADQKKLKDKQEADEEDKRIIERIRKAKEDQIQENLTKLKAELIVAAIIGISNLLDGSQNNLTKPGTAIKPIEKLGLGGAIPHINKPVASFVPRPKEMPKLGYMSLPGINWMPNINRPQ